GTVRRQLRRFHREGQYMSITNMTPRLMLALVLFLGLVSSANAFNSSGTLAAGQETYYDLKFIGGVQAWVSVGSLTRMRFTITVIDSNKVTVASSIDPNPRGLYEVTWFPAKPGLHRIFIKNTSSVSGQFSFGASGSP